MALDVDKVFRFVQFVANKEHRGWVSPSEFNIAAELAQIEAYSKREAVFLATKVVLADLRPFMKSSPGNTVSINGLINYPTGMRHFISARLDADDSKITELTQAELNDVLNSTIVAPDSTHIVCVQLGIGLQIYPITDPGDLTIEYLASPAAPEWAYTTVSSRPVYASGSSTNFEFDDILFSEISMNILANIGVNLKDETVAQYGLAFNQQK